MITRPLTLTCTGWIAALGETITSTGAAALRALDDGTITLVEHGVTTDELRTLLDTISRPDRTWLYGPVAAGMRRYRRDRDEATRPPHHRRGAAAQLIAHQVETAFAVARLHATLEATPDDDQRRTARTIAATLLADLDRAPTACHPAAIVEAAVQLAMISTPGDDLVRSGSSLGPTAARFAVGVTPRVSS